MTLHLIRLYLDLLADEINTNLKYSLFVSPNTLNIVEKQTGLIIHSRLMDIDGGDPDYVYKENQCFIKHMMKESEE